MTSTHNLETNEKVTRSRQGLLKNRNDNKINLNGKWLVIMDTEDRLTKTRKSVDKSCMNLFSNESNMPHGLLSGDMKRKVNNL